MLTVIVFLIFRKSILPILLMLFWWKFESNIFCKVNIYICMCVCVCIHACVCVCAILCPTLWDPRDYSLPGSFVYRIPQVRILEWVAKLSSRGSFRLRAQICVCLRHWQAGSLLLAPFVKPLNIYMGCAVFSRSVMSNSLPLPGL